MRLFVHDVVLTFPIARISHLDCRGRGQDDSDVLTGHARRYLRSASIDVLVPPQMGYDRLDGVLHSRNPRLLLRTAALFLLVLLLVL